MQIWRESSSVKVLAATPREPAFHPQNTDGKRREPTPTGSSLTATCMHARQINVISRRKMMTIRRVYYSLTLPLANGPLELCYKHTLLSHSSTSPPLPFCSDTFSVFPLGLGVNTLLKGDIHPNTLLHQIFFHFVWNLQTSSNITFTGTPMSGHSDIKSSHPTLKILSTTLTKTRMRSGRQALIAKTSVLNWRGWRHGWKYFP